MQINAQSILNAIFSNKKSNTQSTIAAEPLTAEMAALVSGGYAGDYSTNAIGSTQGPEWGDWIKK